MPPRRIGTRANPHESIDQESHNHQGENPEYDEAQDKDYDE